MKCSHLSRTEQAYQKHVKTHYSETYQCKYCYTIFKLKSTLTNHLQKHSKDVLKCQKCGCTFGYRQSYLEHVKYRHRSAKSVPCPICKKMFWTPTNMRAHRAKWHGLVKSLLFLKPGEMPVKSKSNEPPKPKPKKSTTTPQWCSCWECLSELTCCSSKLCKTTWFVYSQCTQQPASIILFDTFHAKWSMCLKDF